MFKTLDCAMALAPRFGSHRAMRAWIVLSRGLDCSCQTEISGLYSFKLITRSTRIVDNRFKNKAIIGLAIWGAATSLAIFAIVILSKCAHQSGQGSLRMATGITLVVSLVVQYAAYFTGGSLLARAKGHSTGMLIFGVFPMFQLIVLALLLLALPDRNPNHASSRSKRKHSEHESPIGRIVRYRRNALVANCAGLAGMVVALVFLFSADLFGTYDNARVAAVLAFLPSYAAVIFGCWWWVRAKNWHDAVIAIGLLPLIVPFIRYVRLIYRVAPMLLPVGMFCMPLILLGVVAVLPDKSGMPKRKRWDRD